MTDLLLEKVDYGSLTAKQKEIYNFQKIAADLADYGFNCIKLPDDWKGADFIACRTDGLTIRVQLKSRPTIQKKYLDKDLWMAFRVDGRWYLVRHDTLIRIVAETIPALQSTSWQTGGTYSWPRPSKQLLNALNKYVL